VQEAGWAPGTIWTGAENLLADDIWIKSVSVLKYRLDKFQFRILLRSMFSKAIFCGKSFLYKEYRRGTAKEMFKWDLCILIRL
jgi:hypothetical protein